jgi:hypothetical protein
MSKRTKAIFAGTSNTMGLGMELEFSPRFQDDEYLKKCKNIPPMDYDGLDSGGYESYNHEDIEIHRKYRWPKLVSEYFNLEEININDPIVEHPCEFLNEVRQAVDVVFSLYDNREDEGVKKLLSETKYIFLEFGYIRWWEDQLHGVNTEFKWPSTPAEIDRFLKDKNVDTEKKQKAIDWLNNVNPIELWERTIFRVKKMQEEFKDIKFILLAWGINSDVFNLDSTREIIDNFVNMPEGHPMDEIYDIGNYIDGKKLQIKDTVKAYNPKYKNKWIYIDHHANSEGHRLIANQIINKLQNETRGLYSI